MSVLVLLPVRELTDLGTEPYQETLSLILKPRSTVFLVGNIFRIRNRVSGKKIRVFFVRVRVRVISVHDVIIYICTALR